MTKPTLPLRKQVRWFSILLILVQGHRSLEPSLAEQGYSGSPPWTGRLSVAGRTHTYADAQWDNLDTTIHLTHTPLGCGRKQVHGDNSIETTATARNWLFLHQRYNETTLKKWHYSRTLLHLHDPLHVLFDQHYSLGIDTIIFSVWWMRKLKIRKAWQLVHNTAPSTLPHYWRDGASLSGEGGRDKADSSRGPVLPLL